MNPSAAQRSVEPPGQRDVPYGFIRITCQCCGLGHKVKDRDGDVPTICDYCGPHQGNLPDKQLARAQKHEQMLRNVVAQEEKELARVRGQLAEAKEQVTAALSSRGALAARIVGAVEDARSHRCPASDVGRDPHVAKFAERHWERRGVYRDDDIP